MIIKEVNEMLKMLNIKEINNKRLIKWLINFK